MGGIDDDTAGSKWNEMLGCDLRRDMRFHIDGSRTRLIMELKLFHRAGDNDVRPDDVRVNGVRQRLEKPLCPDAIGGQYLLTVPDTRRYDPVTCDKMGR
jgi:hypothetical protein